MADLDIVARITSKRWGTCGHCKAHTAPGTILLKVLGACCTAHWRQQATTQHGNGRGVWLCLECVHTLRNDAVPVSTLGGCGCPDAAYQYNTATKGFLNGGLYCLEHYPPAQNERGPQ